MITVLINWLLVAITSYAIGYALVSKLLKITSAVSVEEYCERVPSGRIVIVFLGLAVATAYAEIWSLFSGVNTIALIMLLVVSVIILVTYKVHIKLPSKNKLVVCGVLILLMSFGTSRGYMHFDTNLYHAQAIRWIEEYGVVPGLANLQSRFGYNSAEFALNALYSCRGIAGQSLHTLAGFFALLSSFILVDIKREIRLSDFVRAGLLFYLGVIYSEMISPASDYYAQLLIFDIVILWIDSLYMRDKNELDVDLLRTYQALLSILIVYAITIKLSIGLLVFLAFVPGIYWIRTKNGKSIIACIITGLFIALPYFIRNYIISGWILYPATFIKLGSPDWQLPKGEAQYDAREISMWGRGITRAELWDSVTVFNWLPGWFKEMAVVEKLWVLGSAVAFIIVVILLGTTVIRSIKKKSIVWIFDDPEMDYLIVLKIIALGFLFWFVSAPLVRYGYAYLIILPLLTFGMLVLKFLNKRKATIVGIVVIAVIGAMKTKGLVYDIARTVGMNYYVRQQDYIDGDATYYEIDGIKVYVADDAGQIGYYKFPSTPEVKQNIALRSDDLRNGFRHM